MIKMIFKFFLLHVFTPKNTFLFRSNFALLKIQENSSATGVVMY